jgi:hypothetical protein
MLGFAAGSRYEILCGSALSIGKGRGRSEMFYGISYLRGSVCLQASFLPDFFIFKCIIIYRGRIILEAMRPEAVCTCNVWNGTGPLC